MKKIYYDVVDYGKYHFLVSASEKGLIYLDVATGELANLLAYLKKAKEPFELVADEKKLLIYTEQLHAYFKGQRQTFDLPLDLTGYGTVFQQAVWQELLKIPFGQESSYSQLATAIGRPKATRAVGSAVGKNPIAIIVPCHRVLRKNNSIGGYAGGLPLKYQLLALEEIAVQ